jgi:hypothetical protein
MMWVLMKEGKEWTMIKHTLENLIIPLILNLPAFVDSQMLELTSKTEWCRYAYKENN